jgi:hypothetical protein
MFSFSLLSIALLLGASTISSEDSSYIRLKPSSSTVKAGDKFSVEVYAYANVPVNAVTVSMQYDKTKVKAEGVDRGQSVLTLWTEEPKIEDSKVFMSGGTFRKGFVGEHKIATVRFTALQTGQGEFAVSDVTFLAGDGKGTTVKTISGTDSKTGVYVYAPGEDPSKINADITLSLKTDIDGDGAVDLVDVSSFMGAWVSNNFLYDFNGDGKMTFTDFSIILADVFRKSN